MSADGAPARIGVVGAGTMGNGIAQLGCLAGMETYLHDPFPEALERGAEALRRNLGRGAERGRWSEDDARAAEERLRVCESLDELAPCELVVEAAPERLDLKRELFGRLADICPEAVLASNTSSILIASLAGGAERPEQVVGMHFFNPAPLMPLVEVIPSARTGEQAVAVARAAAEAMGKRVVVVRDGPGFLVNRCGRPINSEAIRLLEERVASHEQIDRIMRMGGGFRMGAFELMDMVGVDVGFEVARSFHEQSFGEPRWKPSQTQARMTAAGLHGRKTGQGFYAYEDGSSHRPDDPAPPAAGGGDGRLVAIAGSGSVADGLRARAAAAGFEVREPADLGADPPELIVDASVPAPVADLAGAEIGLAPDGPPLVTLCADRSLAERGEPGACGFHLLPPVEGARLVELTRFGSTAPRAADAAERLFCDLGLRCEWVGDGPGLVLGRIVCQLVNEGLFALGEGVGSAADIDAATTLGLSHPHGPIEWGRLIGFGQVLATIDGLWRERHEERYRAAPLLRRLAATGEPVPE